MIFFRKKTDRTGNEDNSPASTDRNGDFQEYITRPDTLAELMAAVKGRESVVPPEEPVSEDQMFPLVATRARKREMILNGDNPSQLIGQLFPEYGGVFLGRYILKDQGEGGLRRTFNVFAAPQDMTNEAGHEAYFRYVDAVKRLSSLKGWHGFDGTPYANDKEIKKALEDGSYGGGWVIPPFQLLIGRDLYRDEITQPDNLHAHRDKGALTGTFKTAATDGDDYYSSPHRYMSSTEGGASLSHVWVITFPPLLSHTLVNLFSKDDPSWQRASCRPVRLAPVPQGGMA